MAKSSNGKIVSHLFAYGELPSRSRTRNFQDKRNLIGRNLGTAWKKIGRILSASSATRWIKVDGEENDGGGVVFAAELKVELTRCC